MYVRVWNSLRLIEVMKFLSSRNYSQWGDKMGTDLDLLHLENVYFGSMVICLVFLLPNISDVFNSVEMIVRERIGALENTQRNN